MVSEVLTPLHLFIAYYSAPIVMKPSTNIMEIPAWPADVPTALLNKISLAKLLEGDEVESCALYASCKSSGFFLLDLKGCQDGDVLWKKIETLLGLAEEMCDIPHEKKNAVCIASRYSVWVSRPDHSSLN
jgi:hypothetical protein